MASTKAQAEKEKGNASFKAGKYVDAIGHYTAAILADGKDYTFPLNRAAAYLKLGKNEDAERDCTTVLNLSAWNAKALYRRGQARVGIGKLEEAVDDLTQALKREPANVAVQEELKKATELLEKKKTKTSKPPTEIPSSSILAPQRRRVPIKIIDSEAGPVSSASSSGADRTTRSTPAEPTPTAMTTSTTNSETLKPVSTRSLKPKTSTPPPKSTSSTSTSADATTPTSAPALPAPKPEQPQPQPRTFKDAKQARDSTRPSRVGGGIFRASGENTIFPTRNSSSTPPSTSASVPPVVSRSPPPPVPVPVPVPAPGRIVPVAPAKPPKTWFDFTRAWDADPSTAARWGLILSIRPESIPALFKISLEPALLMSILAVFQEVLSASQGDGDAERVRGYMDAFGKVERFGTVVLFLSRAEKALARGVWEVLGVKVKEDVPKGWNSVWN